jgi:hypothetical protein
MLIIQTVGFPLAFSLLSAVDSHDKRPAQSRFKLPTTKARRRAEPLKTALDFQ